MTIADNLLPLATPLDDLHQLPGNPRRGDVDAVARSLERFGQLKPIVARTDGTIIAGNHTFLAARSLGWSELAVVRTDADEATAKAFALADNRTSELGTYDEQALLDLLTEVNAADPTLLAAASFAATDLDDLLARLTPPPAPLIDPDHVPPAPPPFTTTGDLWHLGPHRLLCGDATVAADVERIMAGRMADMVWTDPPYGVAYVGKTADALTIDNDTVDTDATRALITTAFGVALGRCRPGASWWVAAPPGPTLRVFVDVLDDLDIWHQTIIWVKDRFVMGHGDYHYRHEPVLYGWAPGGPHEATPDRTQDTAWDIARPAASKDHPTMKPVALVERAVVNHTKPGALVLDPFAGSGTTLIAAHQTGRTARLVELDPRYVDVIARRWQEATGVEPVNEATGVPHDFTAPG
jgi:site-specific DNA-methyltransferase (adenine-specific)